MLGLLGKSSLQGQVAGGTGQPVRKWHSQKEEGTREGVSLAHQAAVHIRGAPQRTDTGVA